MKPAVFLDRDGTLIEHVHHLSDPAAVRLVDGAAEAIRELRMVGYVVVLVTNQSVVGRGMLTVDGLRRVHECLSSDLAEGGATLDAIYFCPVAPTDGGPAVIEHPDRKPGPGMLRRAACDLSIDLSRSWMVGDTIGDMLAGRHAGCKGNVLVRTGPEWRGAREEADYVVEDLPSAARLIISAGNGRSQL